MLSNEFLALCNDFFGTEVKKINSDYVFEVYDSEENFEKNVCASFEEKRQEGTAGFIDGVFVFYNETADTYNETADFGLFAV